MLNPGDLTVRTKAEVDMFIAGVGETVLELLFKPKFEYIFNSALSCLQSASRDHELPRTRQRGLKSGTEACQKMRPEC